MNARPVLPVLDGVPVLGVLPELRRDRLGFLLRAARDAGPLARAPLPGGRTLYVATDPHFAREVLVRQARSFKKFAALSDYARPVLGDGLVTSEGELHRRQRRLIAPKFGRREIASFADTMARHAARAVAAWRPDAPFDAHADMTRLTLAIATETMFSACSDAHAAATRDALDAAATYISGEVGRLVHVPVSWPLPRNRRMRRAVEALDRVVYAIVAERRAQPGDHDDLLQRLLDARDDEADVPEAERTMTDRQVRDEVMTLLVAGHETTANSLTWTLLELARHPGLAEALRDEARAAAGDDPIGLAALPNLPLARQFVQESLRRHPPAYMTGREALEDVVLDGHVVPTGATVLVNIYGLHHRPDLYPDPTRFDPARFAPAAEEARPKGAFLPFGDGPRVCIGNHFALMELQIVVAHLARAVRLRATSDAPVPALPRVTLRPGAPVRLTATPW